MSTYPKEYKNQVYILAYGIDGLSDHVDSYVYDAHQAFEIDKTKIKMLVPLDMNNNKIENISNVSNRGLIIIYGTVNKYKDFITPNNSLIRLDQVYIVRIFINVPRKFFNQADTLIISDAVSNETRYQFRHNNINGRTRIIINRYYSQINGIRLTNAFNIGFQFEYLLFY